MLRRPTRPFAHPPAPMRSPNAPQTGGCVGGTEPQTVALPESAADNTGSLGSRTGGRRAARGARIGEIMAYCRVGLAQLPLGAASKVASGNGEGRFAADAIR